MASARLSVSETVEVRFCPRDLDFFRPLAVPSPCHYPPLHPDSGRRRSAEQGHPLLTSFGLTQPHFLSAHCPLSAPGHLAISGCQGGWEMKSSCVDFWWKLAGFTTSAPPGVISFIMVSWFVTLSSSYMTLEHIFRKVKIICFQNNLLIDFLALRLRQNPGVWSRFSNSTLRRGRGVSILLGYQTRWLACNFTSANRTRENKHCFPIHLWFLVISQANIFSSPYLKKKIGLASFIPCFSNFSWTLTMAAMHSPWQGWHLDQLMNK